MEEICNNISALLGEAGTGGYKIYYEEELCEALPEDMRNRETLEAALKNLNGGGYIDVKYARGNAFCISYVKKYAPAVKVAEAKREVQTEAAAPLNVPKKLYVFLSLCAFAGGALGGFVAVLLGVVL